MDRQSFVMVVGIIVSEIIASYRMVDVYGWSMGSIQWLITLFIFAPAIFVGGMVNWMILKTLLFKP